MNFVGALDANLQGATEYKAGGIGPLFGEVRTEEPFPLPELLSRTLHALRKAGVTSVVTLFVDDQEVYTDEEPAADNLDAVLAAVGGAGDLAAAGSFYLMLAHEDDELAHIITVEASVDHPADEAGLTVLDTARLLDESPAEAEEDVEEAVEDDEADLEDDTEPDIVDIDDSDGEALVEAFLRRLEQELHKELALDQPELEVWTDWEGEYDPALRYSSALPGVPGIGG